MIIKLISRDLLKRFKYPEKLKKVNFLRYLQLSVARLVLLINDHQTSIILWVDTYY